MIILDTTTRSLEVVLGGAVTTNQLPFVASYADISQSTFALSAASTNTGTSNSTTAATLIAAPGSSTSRQVKYLTVWNEDTVDADVTIQVNDNSTIRELVTFTLSSGDTLEYLDGRGFAVLDSTGSIKRVNANSQPLNANLTDIAGLTPSDGNVIIGDGSDFITESGATLRTSIGLGTGDTPDFTGITLGGGADVLDVYEEGTFTPVFADATSGGNASDTTLTGKYTRIGSKVDVFIQGVNINTTGLTGANDAVVRALPFTSTAGLNSSGSVYLDDVTFTGFVTPFVNQNSTYCKFRESASGVSFDDLLVSEFSDDASFFNMQLTYQI